MAINFSRREFLKWPLTFVARELWHFFILFFENKKKFQSIILLFSFIFYFTFTKQ